jgi:hypothetical protein
MVNKKVIFLLILSFIAIAVFPQQRKLIEISNGYLIDFIKSENANVSLIQDDALLIEMKDKNPLVELYAPDKFWDLSNNTSIAFEVANIGNSEAMINCHIDDYQWNEGVVALKPGEKITMRVLIKGFSLPEDISGTGSQWTQNM